MKFKIVNLNPFPLRGTSKRYLHLATIQSGFHEYMCFADLEEERIYIEELTGGHLSRIEDNNLASDLEEYVREKGVLTLRPWNLIRQAVGYRRGMPL